MGDRSGGDDPPRRVPARAPASLSVEIVSAGRLRARGLARWLQQAAPRTARGTVVVAVVSDARVRQLNARYRGKNRATDVLSFATDEPGLLGEVVIASGVARKQANLAGHTVQVELRVLALHGLLHLLGYDHERFSCSGARPCSSVPCKRHSAR
jgi:probable rRNA maturation factor